jgi:hypothetical protein
VKVCSFPHDEWKDWTGGDSRVLNSVRKSENLYPTFEPAF